MIIKSALTLCALMAFGLPAIAANKCTVNGKTVYQDTPCHGAGEVIDARPNGAFGEEPPPQRSRRSARDADDVPVNHQAVLNGMATGKPAVGMTENQLEIAMGRPQRINSGDYQGRQRDQLIYERDGVTYYVYVRDGVVSSVQRSEGYKSSRPQKRCLNSIEIRNLETSASSSTITERERRELKHEVWKAKNCL